jgi:mRNA interferase MazF
LRAPRASAPGYRRPVLVIQSDPFNRSVIRTVIAAVITSNTRLARAPGNVLLSETQSGLPRPSVVNVSQIVTLDRTYLTERVGALTEDRLRAVEAGLRLVLSL